MTTTALELRGLDLGYGSHHVVHDVHLTLERGTVHALAGENGSGKSTLFGAISGNLQPWAGEIVVDRQSRRFASPRDAIAAGVAVVSQELSLVPGLSVAENLGIGSYRGSRRIYRRRQVAADLAATLALVGLDLPLDALVSSLTTHERQLVEIARALATGATTILLDEPTSSLDLAEVETLFATIRSLTARGYSFLIITHRSRELHEITDQVSVLRDGHLVSTRPIAEVTDSWLVSSLVGRELSAVFPTRTGLPRPEPVLHVADLRDIDCRLEGASLEVRSGEIVALAGLVGAGRSELLETIYGARSHAAGEVYVGRDRLTGDPAESLRHGLAMIFEERKRQGIVPDLSNADNFGLSDSPTPIVGRASERSRLAAWRTRLGIKGTERQPIGSLSGGNQQKVLIARALEKQPRVLLLDEPTRGVDVGAKVDLYRAIADAADAGCAVLMATSELEEAFGLADRILVLRDGRIVDEQRADEATEESLIAAATGLAHAEGVTP